MQCTCAGGPTHLRRRQQHQRHERDSPGALSVDERAGADDVIGIGGASAAAGFSSPPDDAADAAAAARAAAARASARVAR